jgi:hypothetical protein
MRATANGLHIHNSTNGGERQVPAVQAEAPVKVTRAAKAAEQARDSGGVSSLRRLLQVCQTILRDPGCRRGPCLSCWGAGKSQAAAT